LNWYSETDLDDAASPGGDDGSNVVRAGPLEDGEPALIAAALRDAAGARGMTEIAREAGISLEAMCQAFQPERNPTLETLSRKPAPGGRRAGAMLPFVMVDVRRDFPHSDHHGRPWHWPSGDRSGHLLQTNLGRRGLACDGLRSRGTPG
jgi:hypothetical protein